MKLKYITSTVVAGIFILMVSCNKSEQANLDHSKETPEDHTTYNKDSETAKQDHEDHDDHSLCGVEIGKQGGRVLKNIDGELLLTEDGKVTVFITDSVTLDKLTVLIDSEPVELTKSENNTYTAATSKDKLPASLHIAAVIDGKKSVDSFELSLEKCGECTNSGYLCICHNH